jgi:hypothetical protein
LQFGFSQVSARPVFPRTKCVQKSNTKHHDSLARSSSALVLLVCQVPGYSELALGGFVLPWMQWPYNGAHPQNCLRTALWARICLCVAICGEGSTRSPCGTRLTGAIVFDPCGFGGHLAVPGLPGPMHGPCMPAESCCSHPKPLDRPVRQPVVKPGSPPGSAKTQHTAKCPGPARMDSPGARDSAEEWFRH